MVNKNLCANVTANERSRRYKRHMVIVWASSLNACVYARECVVACLRVTTLMKETFTLTCDEGHLSFPLARSLRFPNIVYFINYIQRRIFDLRLQSLVFPLTLMTTFPFSAAHLRKHTPLTHPKP